MGSTGEVGETDGESSGMMGSTGEVGETYGESSGMSMMGGRLTASGASVQGAGFAAGVVALAAVGTVVVATMRRRAGYEAVPSADDQ